MTNSVYANPQAVSTQVMSATHRLFGSAPTISLTQARASLACERFLPRWDCQNPNSRACGNHCSSDSGLSAVAAKIAAPVSVFGNLDSSSIASRR